MLLTHKLQTDVDSTVRTQTNKTYLNVT